METNNLHLIYTFGRSDRNNRENKEIDKYNMDRFHYIGNI